MICKVVENENPVSEVEQNVSLCEFLYKSYFLHNVGERAQYNGEQISKANKQGKTFHIVLFDVVIFLLISF